jgi:uncharacterized membrane protein YidH (DUF202 family)
MSKNIAEQVLDTIKNKHLKPKPKWEFAVKNYLLWIITAISLLIGGFAFAVIIYMMTNNDWHLYRQASSSFLGFFFITLPYLWIIFLIIFAVFAHYNLRHTKKGYKLKLPVVLSSVIVMSILLGLLFYNIGLAETIDNTFSSKVPYYKTLMKHRVDLWNQPDKGILIGTIYEVHSESGFALKDIKGNIWQVSYATKDQMPLVPNIPIKLLGEKTGEMTFKANIIRPLKGGGGPAMFGKPKMIKGARMHLERNHW